MAVHSFIRCFACATLAVGYDAHQSKFAVHHTLAMDDAPTFANAFRTEV